MKKGIRLSLFFVPLMFFVDTMVAQALCDAPLYGKTIHVIGDSYVRNHKRPYTETWHYKVAEKYQMTYRNYGRNGNCIAFDRERFGQSMLHRFEEMNDTADYVLVIAGHNDAGMIGVEGTMEQFRLGLDSLCQGLIRKYPAAKLAFVTPWRVPRANFPEVTQQIVEVCAQYSIPVYNAAQESGIYVWEEAFRARFFQGRNDTAHLNAEGHALFMNKGERFLLEL